MDVSSDLTPSLTRNFLLDYLIQLVPKGQGPVSTWGQRYVLLRIL